MQPYRVRLKRWDAAFGRYPHVCDARHYKGFSGDTDERMDAFKGHPLFIFHIESISHEPPVHSAGRGKRELGDIHKYGIILGIQMLALKPEKECAGAAQPVVT